LSVALAIAVCAVVDLRTAEAVPVAAVFAWSVAVAADVHGFDELLHVALAGAENATVALTTADPVAVWTVVTEIRALPVAVLTVVDWRTALAPEVTRPECESVAVAVVVCAVVIDRRAEADTGTVPCPTPERNRRNGMARVSFR
jgi:hypothetical protein